MQTNNIEKFSRFHYQTNKLRRGTLYLSIGAVLALGVISCGDTEQSTAYSPPTSTYVPPPEEYKHEQPVAPRLEGGMRITIAEQSKGKFLIVDEKIIDDVNQSRFVVKYRNKKTKSLNLQDARNFLATTPADNYIDYPLKGGSSLSNILWWGSGGYLLGRSINTITVSEFYEHQYPSDTTKEEDEVASGSSSSTHSSSSSTHINSGRAMRGNTMNSAPSQTQRTTPSSYTPTTTHSQSHSAPSNGHTGFFSSSSHSSSSHSSGGG